MKKTILFTVAALAFLAACKKESAQQGGSKASKHQYSPNTSLMKSVNLQGFEPNTMSWADLTIGTDPQDVLYRKAQLYFSIGLTEVVKDSTIADWITRQTLVAEDNVIHFDTLFTVFPATKQIMESVPDPLGIMDNYTFEQVQEMMQYGGYNIKASIYLANAEIADPTYKPITSPGYDLDMGDEDTHPSDVVLGWHLSDNNTISRISMWEEITDVQPAPIFAIDGRATNLNVNAKVLAPQEDPADPVGFIFSDNTDYRVSITKYGVNVRHDVGAKSELYIKGVCANWETGDVRGFLRHGCSTAVIPSREKLIANIHRRDVGKTFTSDSYFCRHHSPSPLNFWFGEYDHYYPIPGSATRMSRKLLIYNTFEYDSYASPKPLTPPSLWISTSLPTIMLNVKGKMSRHNEWYAFDPAWPVSSPLNPILILPYPRIGWSQFIPSGKANLELKTINWCTF